MPPAGVGALCGARDGTRENMGVLWEYVERFGRAVDYLYRPRFHVHGGAAAWGEQGTTARGGPSDADRPGAAGVGNRLDRRLFAASERARGAEFSDRSGPADQAASPGQGEHNASGQRVFGEGILAGMEREFTRPARTRKTCIARWQRVSNWAPRSATSSRGSSPTTIPFPITASNIRLSARMCKPGMKRQNLRVELWLNGELKGRYQGRYVGIRSAA